MNISDVISKALEDYDSVKPIIKHLQKNASFQIVYPSNPDIQRSVYRFTDKITNNLILESESELLAIYYKKYNVWSWAWANTSLSEGDTYFSKQLVEHAIRLKSDMSYIKSLLITSRGLIKDDIQIDINLALAASIIKQPFIFTKKIPVTNDKDDFVNHYVILLNKDALTKLKIK